MRSSPSRAALRERVDDGLVAPQSELPLTHQCDWYLATDCSPRGTDVKLGALLETPAGVRCASWRTTVGPVDNNTGELLALHFGLDRAAAWTDPTDRLGILLDHDALANAVVTTQATEIDPPAIARLSPHHWGGITARLARLDGVSVGLVSSHSNPAHELVNPSVRIGSAHAPADD